MTKHGATHCKLRKVVKVISIVLVCIILLPIIVLFVGRCVKDVSSRMPGGVRDKRYIELGGIEQFISIT